MMQQDEFTFRDLLRSLRFLWVSVALFLVALILEPVAHEKNYFKVSQKNVERDFHKKLNTLEKDAREADSLISKWNWPEVFEREPAFIERLSADDDGLAFFLLKNDTLVFWSDNSQVVNTSDLRRMESSTVYNLPNSWVYTRVYDFKELRLIGLVFLKKYFPYNNDFVKNAFLVGRNIPESYNISIPPVPDGISVRDESGKYVFTLTGDTLVESKSFLHWFVISLYFLTLLAVLLMFRDLLLLGQRIKPSAWWLLALAADLFILRFVSWRFHVPHCVYELNLFTTFDYPMRFLESRGDILLSVILLLFFAWWFFRFFEIYPGRLSGSDNKENPRLVQSIALIGWIIAVLAFLFTEWLIRYLLTHRSGLLEVNQILSVRFDTILDIMITVGMLVAFLLILYRVIDRIKERVSWIQALIGLLLASGLLFGTARTAGYPPDLFGMGFLIAVSIFFIIYQYSGHTRFTHGYMVVLLVFIAVFEVARFDRINRIKDESIREAILKKLTTEHDPIAEMLLSQYDDAIAADSILASMVLNLKVEQNEITAYLKDKYFGLYWNRYQIQPLVCDSMSRAIIQPDNIDVPCLSHFISDVKDAFGRPVSGSDHFYFLDNFDGLIDYLGLFRFSQGDFSGESVLIINIDSRLVTQELGYPELLITGAIGHDSLSRDYSYAKYHQGFLQSVTGEFSYSFNSDIYPSKTGEKVNFKLDGYDHLIYKLNPNDEVVISRPSYRILDYLITFSYFFVFLYLLWLIINVAIHFPKNLRFPVLVLKQRIQLTIIAVLVISLLVIGGGITYYVIRQYEQSNLKLIEEKSRTLLTDLQYKLGMEQEIKPDWRDESYRNMEELLLKFSYVFNTDINLYDPEGKLLASSRPEVYEFSLIGRWMNPLAYTHLHHYGKSSYIHKESIEYLGYISSYMPVYNQNNRLIAYLNLPFFSKQSQIRNEISAILVATLNAYFILILLSIFLAVLLANQVTRPLHLIQAKLAGLKLGGRNQGIEYHRKDEIGQLVEEYNRMVTELQVSADKLARSERESAWREMARQIAHEIKNPLTPMKLSVQHLRKAWKDKAPDLDHHIDKVTRTLIEQIETLSAIATEFSKFAKMPGAHFEQIDLVTKLKSISQLFEESCRISFEKAAGTPDEVVVYTDKEQILQVFNNLIRNAIQAVPEGTEPVVRIELESGTDSVVARVSDNGTGIPEELQPKMFEPNFTTKGSGMGLGLAISKKYIEGSGGEIWFETEKGKGTTFFVKLPLYRQE